MPTPEQPYTQPYPPGRRGYGGDGISPRKVILGLILAGSILFFFFILFVGAIAVIQEGSLKGASHIPLMGAVKRVIAHFLHHH